MNIVLFLVSFFLHKLFLFCLGVPRPGPPTSELISPGLIGTSLADTQNNRTLLPDNWVRIRYGTYGLRMDMYYLDASDIIA